MDTLTMRKQLIFVGIISALTTVTAATVGLSMQSNVQAHDSSCYMKSQDGKLTDLSSICGKSSNAAQSEELDPDTPITIKLPSSDKPSALWNTVPDLPNAPQQGETYLQDEPTQAQRVDATSGQSAQ
ncbi:hypothetical protein IQ266_27215 [filamentous cyanobacterium LEGE 11480]|uniref:Uncharacterized protein n=1 Tax=Romeriopsis navalis LEGE 11480 TaxID=2777977 RepID=A0A928Z7R8_9CYAN|nr:hypothetical protein [Romeriopsis navalis]MBE9033425.1 hypothetical protein [Romeriopsis navalis LEGE 11480]